MFLEFIDKPEIQIFIDVLIASFLTMLIGVEREAHHKAAGVRTNMIVGGFTCLMVNLMNPLIIFSQSIDAGDAIDTDPIRVLQAIVVGVSFIGAGTILKSREGNVTGLTTAATLLYSAGVGISVAIGYYILAVFLALFILLINKVINYIIKKYTDFKASK